jgi:hypothetical protein
MTFHEALPEYDAMPSIFLIFGWRHILDREGKAIDKIEKFSIPFYKNNMTQSKTQISMAENHLGFIEWDSIKDSTEFVKKFKSLNNQI